MDRALMLHPKLCVISELFEPAGPNPLLDAGKPIQGSEFLQLLDRETMAGRREVWRQKPTPEVLALPKEKPWSLWNCYTLPALAPEGPEALDLEVRRWMEGQEEAPAVHHLRALFAYLAARRGAERWVERTGGSSYQTQKILDAFPDARIVHLVRDGIGCALSMWKHPVFHAILEEVSGGRRPSTPADFGAFWSQGVIQACDALDQLPGDRVHLLRYEELCGPRKGEVLLELACFLRGSKFSAAEDRIWAERAAETFRPIRPRDGDDPSLRELAAACEPGHARLAQQS